MAAQGYARHLQALGYTIGEECEDLGYRETFRLKFGTEVDTFALQIWYKRTFPEGFRQVMFNDPINLAPTLNHKNVAKVMHVLEASDAIVVILQYPRDPKSTLEEEWNSWELRRIPLFLSKKWLHGVAQGLAYLHTRGYAHRILSASNILIKSRNTAQISSYCLLPVANQVVPLDNFEVTLRPPRTADQIVDHQKDDVWTFGVILFQLVNHERVVLVQHPDPGHDVDEWDPQEYNQLLLDQEQEWQAFAFVHGSHPQGAKDLLAGILWVDPDMRSSMEDIANDEWLRSEEPVDADVANSGAQAVSNEASMLYNPLSDKLRNDLKIKGIKKVNYISKGGFGAVYRVQLKQPDRYEDYNNEFAALKICNLKDASQSYREIYSLRERELIGNVHHENIIRCLEIIEDNNRHFCILMELAKSDLRTVIRDQRNSQKPYDEMEAEMKKYLFDVCKGMAHLHSVGWSHRDMKPLNCLIKPDDTAVITDFSFGKQVVDGQLSETYCGTYNYRSPQIIMHNPYSPRAADVWAIGCTIYESLVHRNLITMDRDLDPQGREKILQGKTQTIASADLSVWAKNLIFNCLAWEESDRSTMQTVLEHPFFTSSSSSSGSSFLSTTESSHTGSIARSKQASSRLGALKEQSETSSGKAPSYGPSTKQTTLPVAGPSGVQHARAGPSGLQHTKAGPSGLQQAKAGPSGLQELKGDKRKREELPEDTSS